MWIYLCENTLDGILTGVYQAWEDRHGHANNRLEIEKSEYNRELFADYISVVTNYEKAQKVAKTIQKKISQDAFHMIARAAVSCFEGKADAIYRFIILGLYMGSEVVNHLSEENVHKVFTMDRRVGFEIQHYYGFLRFEELDNGVMFSKIRPDNDILELIAPHFADRYSIMNWMIADMGRGKIAFFKSGDGWFLSEVDNLENLTELLKKSMNEENMQKIWKHFVDAIGIKERYNVKLRKQMLPLRFREFMSEFVNNDEN